MHDPSKPAHTKRTSGTQDSWQNKNGLYDPAYLEWIWDESTITLFFI